MSSDSHLEPQSLPLKDWWAIGVLICLLSVLTVITSGKDHSTLPKHLHAPHFLINEEIEVWIEGAVEHPGSYKLKKGARLEELLSLALLKSDADLAKVKRKSKMKNGQTITIPRKEMITVFIEGEIENSGAISLPKGSIVSDLIPMMRFRSNAKREQLHRKRKLKNGETIIVKARNR